jgi:phosphatidylethanolamine/phosphatidyl-N-methylethanolamine N-methyltransferase
MMARPLRKDDKADRLKDEARFLKSWFEKPLVIGAVSPSGPALARMMAAYADPAKPGSVIELGPGTGPVTEALLARGFSPDRLILLEFNDAFVPLLKQRFPGVNVVHGDAYAVRELVGPRLNRPACAVISSLPLLTKPVGQRVKLLRDCFDLASADARFIQFTYTMKPPIPLEVLNGITADGSPRIWLNLPPARVYAYRRLHGHQRAS